MDGGCGLQIGHPVCRCQLPQGFLIVGCLDLIVEEAGKARAVGLIVQMVEHLVGADETIALSDGIPHVGFRQMIVQSGQHLVDALSDRVESEFVDDLKVILNLRQEEGFQIQTVLR